MEDWRKKRKGEDQSAFAPTLPRIPSSSALEYISDLTSRNGLQLDDAARKAWQRFGDRRAYPRKLLLEPHKKDAIPTCYRYAHIDVHACGVYGKSHLYRLKEVTGVDERVQAVVANQEITAHCLLAAMNRIEEENLQQFSFVCHGATHRSVACCMLLAALAYPNASVHMTTRRTQDAQDAAKAAPKKLEYGLSSKPLEQNSAMSHTHFIMAKEVIQQRLDEEGGEGKGYKQQ